MMHTFEKWCLQPQIGIRELTLVFEILDQFDLIGHTKALDEFAHEVSEFTRPTKLTARSISVRDVCQLFIFAFFGVRTLALALHSLHVCLTCNFGNSTGGSAHRLG